MGNQKLEDGNLCKDCAKQLSPWFSDRRRSTVEDIKRQLAYREENRGRASQFRTTRSYGEDCKVLLDEDPCPGSGGRQPGYSGLHRADRLPRGH